MKNLQVQYVVALFTVALCVQSSGAAINYILDDVDYNESESDESSSPESISSTTEEGDVDSECVLAGNSVEDFYKQSWVANLGIKLYTGKYVNWPVVIIGPNLLLTSSKPFRAPNQRLRIPDPLRNHYIISFGIASGNDTVISEADTINRNPNLEVSYIRPYKEVGRVADYWMKSDNDFVLIHLKHPINFTNDIRPMCLPKWDSAYYEDKVNNGSTSIIPAGYPIMIYGWRCEFYYALKRDTSWYLVYIHNQSVCNETWMSQAEFSDTEELSYKNRVCGKPEVARKIKDADSVVDPGFCADKPYYGLLVTSTRKQYLIGTFNGFAQGETETPIAYFSLITPKVLEWIEDNKRCGPNQFTCNDGECLPLDKRHSILCDQINHCNDASDEDPIFCRATNYCPGVRFECGIYGGCVPPKSGKVTIYCDGERDCPNGEDEDPELYNCQVNQLPSWFTKYWAALVVPVVFVVGIAVSIRVWVKVKAMRRQLYLTDEEIFEFRQGSIMDEPVTGNDAGSSESSQLNSMQMPYIYSIGKDKFKFGREIGAGAFGKVYEGIIQRKPVAIKVLKKELGDKEMFKAFLVELKIMAFVNFIHGGHQNVVRLIGAYTDEIRDLLLYIAVEYCPNGSITDYIKNNAASFQQYDETKVENTESEPADFYVRAVSLQENSCVSKLNRWSQQIADGMCFLADLKIVHGDLACRNILLDHNLNAKISDFGLSRQIYYYNLSCVVDKNTCLPWRWMAPEVISNMKISTKSDVWSFGVTLWEMYTIGAVPYGGINWTPNFVDQLRCGLRLAQPIYASNELHAIINECWYFDAQFRPDFEMIKKRLAKVFE